jgi:hypothetical protein
VNLGKLSSKAAGVTDMSSAKTVQNRIDDYIAKQDDTQKTEWWGTEKDFVTAILYEFLNSEYKSYEKATPRNSK